MNRNSEIDRPTRMASDQTIRLVLPLSCIMKYSADTEAGDDQDEGDGNEDVHGTGQDWRKKLDQSIIAPHGTCRGRERGRPWLRCS